MYTDKNSQAWRKIVFYSLACRCMMGGSNGVGQPVMANGIAPSGGGAGGGDIVSNESV